MVEISPHALRADSGKPTNEKLTCKKNDKYALKGPQVDPQASWWIECRGAGGDLCPFPRPVTLDELLSRVDPSANQYPTDVDTLRIELEELIMLARLRDEAAAVSHRATMTPQQEPQRDRLPLSPFLQLRPQPLGAVVNTARDGAFPVINSGRELARYFESETPGLQFRHALNYMIRETLWSPPRQALVWAALDTAIYSALQAAWYFKWRGGPGVQFRPRPWECYEKLDVLFDRVPNSTNSADGERRALPFGAQPLPSPANRPEPQVPESFVADLLTTDPSQPTPGTPRHPAYPSGHSTYSAAAATLLIAFFPQYTEELRRLADNTGMARLWAGVHWRSDHTFGQLVGSTVAKLIVEQIEAGGIHLDPVNDPVYFDPPNPVPRPCP